MQPHPYPSMPPHNFFSFPPCTSTPMHAPYVVSNHPHIPPLGYLHRQPSILTYYMLPNIIHTDTIPHSSRRMSKHRRIRRNQYSDLLENIKRESRIIREEVNYLGYHSDHASLRQYKWGGSVSVDKL